MTRPETLIQRCPEIQDIVTRLNESEKAAKVRTDEASAANKSHSSIQSEFVKKRSYKYYGDHAVISHYYKGAQWLALPNVPKEGGRAFMKDLVILMDSRQPDAIRVRIYKGKGRAGLPDYENDLWIGADETRKEAVLNGVQEKENRHQENETLTKRLDSLAEMMQRQQPEDFANSRFEIEKLKLELQFQTKENELKAQIKDLQNQHQHELKELQQVIREKEEEIEELEEELEDMDGELGSVKDNKTEEKEKQNSLQSIVAGIGTKILTNTLKENPSILKVGLGLSDEEIKKIWTEVPVKALNAANDSSTFEAASGHDLSGLEPLHRQGIEGLVGLFGKLSQNQFRKCYTINTALENDLGEFNEELADNILRQLKPINE